MAPGSPAPSRHAVGLIFPGFQMLDL